MYAFSALRPILDVRSDDEDTQRRGRNLILIALGIVVFALVLASFAGVDGQLGVALGLVLACVIVQGLVIVLARRGLVTPAALLMTVMSIAGTVAAHVAVQDVVTLPFQLVLPLLIAGLTLRPMTVGFVYVLALVGMGVMVRFSGAASTTIGQEVFIMATGLLTITALISGLNSNSTQRSLEVGRQARAAAETATAMLQVANQQLEARVAERTQALRGSLEAQEQQAITLRAALNAQEQLDAMVNELSLPIIPVRRDTLVVPLVGVLDGTRTAQLLERVLVAVERQAVRHVLIDITGVPIVDTQVASALLKVAMAMQLLGARATLVGMRPEVAQTLVNLGVDLRDLSTEATLQQGLERVGI